MGGERKLSITEPSFSMWIWRLFRNIWTRTRRSSKAKALTPLSVEWWTSMKPTRTSVTKNTSNNSNKCSPSTTEDKPKSKSSMKSNSSSRTRRSGTITRDWKAGNGSTDSALSSAIASTISLSGGWQRSPTTCRRATSSRPRYTVIVSFRSSSLSSTRT